MKATPHKKKKNQPCGCGSGKKFKRCCQLKLSQQGPNQRTDLNSAAHLFERACSHYQGGRLRKAESDLRSVLKKASHHADALHLLGVIHSRFGNFPQAIRFIKRSLSIAPNCAEAYNNLGVAFENKGEATRAFEAYSQSLKLNPKYSKAHNNLGNMHRNNGEMAKARACYEKAVALRSDSVVFLSNLGNLLKEIGDTDGAMAASQKAWMLEPESPSGLVSAVRLAILYFLKMDYNAAIDTLERSKDILNRSDEAFHAAKQYWSLLQQLVQNKVEQGRAVSQGTAPLYVVGESHMLSLQDLVLDRKGVTFHCQGSWIEGCKIWHLANDTENPYKYQFRRILNVIPKQSAILLTLGEIDCRLNEGMLKAWKNSNGKTIKEIVATTVKGYINFIAPIVAERQQKLIISGVSAPNISSSQSDHEGIGKLLTIISYTNELLSSQSYANDFRFLDLFSVTNSGNGLANGAWHLDQHHLHPKAYAEAFKFFLKDRKQNLPGQELTDFDIDELLAKAVEHHQNGLFQNAERLYRIILNELPDHTDANHNIGVLARQHDKVDIALPHFKLALEKNPNNAQYWLSYIDALFAAGHLEASRQVLEKARQLGLKGNAVDILVRKLS